MGRDERAGLRLGRSMIGVLKDGDVFSVLARSELARRLASIDRTSKRGVCRYCLAWKICRGYCLAESYHVYRELEALGFFAKSSWHHISQPSKGQLGLSVSQRLSRRRL